MKFRILMTILMSGLVQIATALDSDSEQPATLDADDMEMDFATGVRTYRGSVVFTQGSIRMTCDELVTYLNDGGSLDKAICTGNPARFKQRPEGQKNDVKGTALEITMDQIAELVTLNRSATVEQGTSTITGTVITYNLATEKANVKGGGSQSTQSSSTATESGSPTDTENVSAEVSDTDSSDKARPSLTIQPRKKEQSESD